MQNGHIWNYAETTADIGVNNMDKNLRFQSGDGLDINLFLRGNRIAVEGDSATGKTYLWKQLNTQEAENIYPICYENIKNNNSYEATLRFINKSKGLIIVIDQANDVFRLRPDFIEFIDCDENNQYILFGRDLEVAHSLSEVATLEIKNGQATLNYKFSDIVR